MLKKKLSLLDIEMHISEVFSQSGKSHSRI